MRVEQITENKDDYIDTLMIGDSSEDNVRYYLEEGNLYGLYEDEILRSVSVVIMLNNRKCVLKNLCTIEEDRGQGYGSHLLDYICEVYADSCDLMYVEIKKEKPCVDFYKKRGFSVAPISQAYFERYYQQKNYGNVQHEYLTRTLISAVNVKRVVDLALKAGELLLQNGGEIFRVEETIDRICNRFYVDKIDTFVLSHGIFISVRNGENDAYTRVKNVPLASPHLGIVAAVNSLSREISGGQVDINEAFERLDEIEKMPPPRPLNLMLAAGFGAGFFGYFLGSTIPENIACFFIAVILYLWVIFAKRHGLNKMILNTIGGVLITSLSVLITRLPLPFDLSISGMTIGAIMPLIPGLAFVNAIRDIADSDFLSGTVRMIDAILVFVYIAVGVGVALGIFNNLLGGIAL
ncbi:uncharacterized membrane protein YjjP (DUF1212 family)/GNAT superfamily N-acetyltransferase [Lachnospiraceae bacterium PFB1-21]